MVSDHIGSTRPICEVFDLVGLLFGKFLYVHLILKTQVMHLPYLLVLLFKVVHFLDELKLVDSIFRSHATILNVDWILFRTINLVTPDQVLRLFNFL